MPEEREDAEKKEEKEESEAEFVEVGVPNFYINNIRISSTPMDVAIILAERLDRKSSTIKARAVMTPVHAKLFARALLGHVERWEQRWGEIQIPEPLSVTNSSDSQVSSSEPEQLPSQSPTDASR